MIKVMLLLFAILITSICSANAQNLSAPSAREMYVSCILLSENEDLVNSRASNLSPSHCGAAILKLITEREGKENRNAGQKDSRLNFCLPKTTRPELLMIDGFILEYEKALGSTKEIDLSAINGAQYFAVAMVRKYPCN